MSDGTVPKIPTQLREQGVTVDMWQRQREIEEECAQDGVERITKAETRAGERNKSAPQPTGEVTRSLVAQVINPVAELIERDLKASSKGRPTRHQSVLRMIFRPVNAKGEPIITPRLAAFIALRDTLNGLYLRQHAKHLAETIGQSIEDEIRWQALIEADREAAARTRQYLRQNTSHHRHRRNALMGFLRRFNVECVQWRKSKQVQVGACLTDYLRDVGILEVRTLRTGVKRTNVIIVPTEETDKWLASRRLEVMATRPGRRPLVVPPKDWTELVGGGLWFRGKFGEDIAAKVHIPHALRPLSLIGRSPAKWRKTIKPESLQVHIDAVNALQRTAWKINPGVYATATRAWSKHLVIAGLPTEAFQAKPERPSDIATNGEAKRAWSREARQWHKARAKWHSATAETRGALKMAEAYVEYDRLWFAYTCDFRGRVYPVADFLHPQGSDLAKALLTFAEAIPLGTQEAADWLAIHVANTWGNDKVSFADRIKWTKDNTPMILACADDPLYCLEWTKADKGDKPWQFLAACFEWAGYMREGLAWKSSVPVALDGTCSGLQHYSAMLRDEVGGRATNLIPSDTPQDIYRDVADETVKALHVWAEVDSGTMGRWAREWITFGIDRSITKRPTMTLPYGSTPFSCMKYVGKAVRKKIAEGSQLGISKDELGKAVAFLAQLVWASIGVIVKPAQDCMRDIQNAVRHYVKTAPLSAIEWRSPSGFPVRQWCPETEVERVRTRYGDNVKTTDMWVVHEGAQADANAMANATPPNFVHSCDAAHLALAVLTASAEGIKNVAAVHDSFGTHAAHTGHLSSVLRTEFVKMYSEADALGTLWETLCPGTRPPQRGNAKLDIAAIIDSPYIFA